NRSRDRFGRKTVQSHPQLAQRGLQLGTLVRRNVLGVLWVGHETYEVGISRFGMCEKSCRVFRIAKRFFRFGNVSKCAAGLHLSPQKFHSVPPRLLRDLVGLDGGTWRR